MDEVKLSLRTHRSRISTIIKDGFKNSFEVAPTASWMTQNVDDYVAQRKAAEHHALGIPFEAGAESRPVYGFARMSDDFTTAVGGKTSYGEVLINLKATENLKAIASAGQEGAGIGDTMNLTQRLFDRSTGEFVSDPATGRIVTGTLPLRETLQQDRILSTGISASVNLNTADRTGITSSAQQFESLPIPQRKMPQFLEQVSSLVQGNVGGGADSYVELSFFDRLKAGDIESIDIIRRPFDSAGADARDMPEALKGGLHSIRGEEASQRLLQAAQEDINLASSLRSQLDEAGFSNIPIRTGSTIPIYGVNSRDQSLVSQLESLGGFRQTGGMTAERTVFDTAEKTAEELLGIDKLFKSEEFGKMTASMIPSKGFDARNAQIGTGVFSSLTNDGRATAAIAQVAAESTKPEAMVADAVTQAGGMARRTLSGVLEAGEVAAKVMRTRF
jgi:hypothetical protein